MRAGELCVLRISDVDPFKRLVRVRQAVWRGISNQAKLFVAHDHFATPDQLLIQPQSVLVRCRLRPRSGWPAHHPHSRRGLENIRRKWAAVDVKLHTQVPRTRYPRNLITRIKHNYFRNESYQYWPFCHRSSHSFNFNLVRFAANSTIAHPIQVLLMPKLGNLCLAMYSHCEPKDWQKVVICILFLYGIYC